MKKQVFRVNHGTYPFDVMVFIGSSHEEVSRTLGGMVQDLKEEELELLKMDGEGRTGMLEGGQTVIRLKIVDDMTTFHKNIAHEVFHAVEFLFHRIGNKHRIDSGEAWAYQIAHLTEQIYKKLRV